jgi:hypothetical protein
MQRWGFDTVPFAVAYCSVWFYEHWASQFEAQQTLEMTMISIQALISLHAFGLMAGNDMDSSDGASHTVPRFGGLSSLLRTFQTGL